MVGDHTLKNNNILPEIYPVACHTDHVGPDTIFVAISGMKQDGINYIPLALEKGARKIVVQKSVIISEPIMQLLYAYNAELVYVENARKALAELSAQAIGYPAKKLKIIGITGTKGKTTTTFLLEHILRNAGKKTAMLSTVYNKIGDAVVATKLTTQQPDYLHIFFDACVKRDVEYVIMEVAAQAFSLYRVYGLHFDAAIFTNFSQEHGEFYATIEDYFAAKMQIVDHMKAGAPLLVNADDEKVTNGAKVYGNAYLFSPLEFLKRSINHSSDQNINFSYRCPTLLGKFNQYNVAAAAMCAELLHIESVQIQKALENFPGVPGRLEKYSLPNGALGVIDYAHNPSSFEAVLSELRTLTDHLIVIFGCGGERDSSKRPLMGGIASSIADRVILTADNPRSESLSVINQHILAGVAFVHTNKVEIEDDRQRAIQKAYAQSRAGSIIVLLGKGPDEYQIIQGVTYPLSEKEILKSL